MNKFYEIKPLDTLFFRGSTPMEAGIMTAISIFPPPVSVIKGALWTAYCRKNNKAFSEGLNEDCEIPIEITGFYIKKSFSNGKSKYYVPAPSIWFYDSDEKVETSEKFDGKTLCIAKSNFELFAELGMQMSAGEVVFVSPKEDAKSLANAWISVDFIRNPKSVFSKDDVILDKDILSRENRTGVALDSNKHTIEGKLYSSTHIRLQNNISIVISVKSEIDFESGKMILGGEQRLVAYKKLEEDINIDLKNVDQYLSLVPIEATEENLSNLVASSKLMISAGWDLAKGFHKSTTSWIPAGAVFNKKIKGCVPLAQKGE